MAAVTRSRPLPPVTFVLFVVGIMTPPWLPGGHRKERAKWLPCPPCPRSGWGGGPCEAWWRGHSDSVGPSTALRAVPLPMTLRVTGRIEKEGLPPVGLVGHRRFGTAQGGHRVDAAADRVRQKIDSDLRGLGQSGEAQQPFP